MSKSEIPNLSMNHILQYLWSHKITKIGHIQLSLQKRFPDTYKKGGNLTQIHRHLKKLKELGLIDWQTSNGETWYFPMKKSGPYIVSLINTEIYKIEGMVSELRIACEEIKRDPSPEMTTEEREEFRKNTTPSPEIKEEIKRMFLENIKKFSSPELSQSPHSPKS